MFPPEDEVLEKAMRVLPRQEAEIIWDVYHHQMPLNDVARQRNLPPQRVQAIHARALRLLRRHLKT
jgi:DNA-directed RNA polymerase sigma subunit (sigma70/sigma32)